ncbi:Uncharacterised protein [Shigella sonnei]|nr:Uncharacterised protein [Shigella sonnei]
MDSGITRTLRIVNASLFWYSTGRITFAFLRLMLAMSGCAFVSKYSLSGRVTTTSTSCGVMPDLTSA